MAWKCERDLFNVNGKETIMTKKAKQRPGILMWISLASVLTALTVATGVTGCSKEQVPDSDQRRQIIEALNNKDAALVCKLANTHPELHDAKGSDGMTPLHVAAGFGDRATAELLLSKGAKVNVKNNDGDTPLNAAAVGGNKDVAELLLDKGADVNAKNTWGVTPLYHAVARNHTEVAELLLAKGADVNVKADDGKTLLSMAIATHRDAIATLLRAHGAKE
jgi:ankyrin repeat protein